MNRTFSLSSSSALVHLVAAFTLGVVVVGCAASAEEESPEATIASVDDSAYESDPQTREHILLAKQVGVPSVDGSRPATTIDSFAAAPGTTRCGTGNTCTETSISSCDDFRKSCKSQKGCGTTSAGAGDIAVVSCIAIPTRP